MTEAFIFLNGEFPVCKNFYKNLNIDTKHLFCADGGALKALELNYTPREVWGDFDSLDENSLNILKSKNTIVKTFDKNKDFTDGELLISYVSSLNYDKIYVIGGFGGRVDHFLTNINLIFKYKNLIFLNELEKLFLVTNNLIIKDSIGKRISFIPFSDTVNNLNLTGFLYPLKNHLLKRGDSTCLSNIITSNIAQIHFDEGKLLGVLSLS